MKWFVIVVLVLNTFDALGRLMRGRPAECPSDELYRRVTAADTVIQLATLWVAWRLLVVP